MPAGVVIEIPDKVRAKVSKIIPAVDWGDIKSAADYYSFHVRHSRKAGIPLRKELDSVITLALQLRNQLLMLSEEGRNALWDAASSHVRSESNNDITTQLSSLSACAREAFNAVEVKEGKPPSIRQAFVRTIAGHLKRAGYSADAKPNGPLCQVIAALLEAYGDDTKDIPALVKNALREN